jgi:hypothetical protein
VKEEFHGEEAEQEADAVFYCSGSLDACGWVFELGHVVVEGYDWTREV